MARKVDKFLLRTMKFKYQVEKRLGKLKDRAMAALNELVEKYKVMVDGAEKHGLPMGSLIPALLLSIKYSLEQTLKLEEKLASRHEILDRVPMVVYQVAPNGEVLYANRQGTDRLLRGKPEKIATGPLPALPEAVLNYRHTQIPKAFLGIPSHNRELVWIVGSKTYEDLADVWPVYRDGAANGSPVLSNSSISFFASWLFPANSCFHQVSGTIPSSTSFRNSLIRGALSPSLPNQILLSFTNSRYVSGVLFQCVP